MSILPINQIVEGDCVQVMDTFPKSSVDCIFCDPPYFLQLQDDLIRPDGSKVAAVNDQWDQFASFKDYDQFTREWLTAAGRVLKNEGTMWVMGSYSNIHRVGTILQDLGFWTLNEITWSKANPMPQMKGTRFCNSHETLLWVSKTKDNKKYTFNYKELKAANEDKQMKSVWELPICTGKERLVDADGNKAHSTQKPEALLRRILHASTQRGDVVLDPMSGSGTTCAVAKKLGRYYVGIERERTYVNISRERVANVEVIDEPEMGEFLGKKKPKIPFVFFVETGKLTTGQQLRLYSSPTTAKDIYAVVHSNGTITAGGVNGSIHGVAKTVLGLPSANGWTHWHWFNPDTGKEEPIDTLRMQTQAEWDKENAS